MADDTKKDAEDEIEGKKTKNQVDGSSKERYGKEGEEMYAGAT
jgi:hypothetical protein